MVYFNGKHVSFTNPLPQTSVNGNASTAITTATTTLVKSGVGGLGSLLNAGNLLTGVVTVYDSLTATGKKIWSGTLAAGQVLHLGVPIGIGITVVTAAADTLLITYS